MTTLSIIAWMLGLGGLGGAGLLAFLVATGGIAIPLALKGVWDFLNSSIGHLVLAALVAGGMYLAGDVRGRRIERANCESRIQASVKAAQDFDQQLAAEQKIAADRQRQEAEARMAAAEQRVVDYEKTHKGCEISPDDAGFLNDDGRVPTPPGRVLPNPPQPPRRP